MFEIYENKKPDYLKYAAVASAVVSYFASLYFVFHLELNEFFWLAAMFVPNFVYKAIMNSNYNNQDN